jgi:hypothetical protein
MGVGIAYVVNNTSQRLQYYNTESRTTWHVPDQTNILTPGNKIPAAGSGHDTVPWATSGSIELKLGGSKVLRIADDNWMFRITDHLNGTEQSRRIGALTQYYDYVIRFDEVKYVDGIKFALTIIEYHSEMNFGDGYVIVENLEAKQARGVVMVVRVDI